MRRGAVVAACLLAAGCGATHSTKPITLHSLSDVCAGSPGLTGQHVLSLLQPLYTATYAGTTPLTLTVTYNGGTITCDPVTDLGVPGVRLAVDAQLVTDDGTFDESLAASVRLTDPEGSELHFVADESVADVRGTFKSQVQTAGWMTVLVFFDGELFQSSMTNGQVGLYESNGPDCTNQPIVASWQ